MCVCAAVGWKLFYRGVCFQFHIVSSVEHITYKLNWTLPFYRILMGHKIMARSGEILLKSYEIYLSGGIEYELRIWYKWTNMQYLQCAAIYYI